MPALGSLLSNAITSADANALLQIAPMAAEDVEAALSRVQERLRGVDALQAPRAAIVAHPASHADQASGSRWSLVPESQWQPCPFGMLPGGIQPSLEVM